MTASKRYKVYCDEAKVRQTSHWDLDYLPRTRIHELMRREREMVLKPRQPYDRITAAWRTAVSALSILAITATAYLVSA